MLACGYKNTSTKKCSIAEDLDGFMPIRNEVKIGEKMHVDVVLLTKNAAFVLRESNFKKCIVSIKCNIPVNNK